MVQLFRVIQVVFYRRQAKRNVEDTGAAREQYACRKYVDREDASVNSVWLDPCLGCSPRSSVICSGVCALLFNEICGVLAVVLTLQETPWYAGDASANQ